MTPRRRRTALSLLELMAIVLILGIIAAVVVRRITMSGTTAKENACFQNKSIINSAVEQYFFENGSWPTVVQLAAAANFPDGVPNCPVTGNAYALDDTTKRISGHTPGSH